MREYGQIQCGFWQSDDAQAFSDAGKLLAAYLMTGPHSNGIGCYRCPDGYVMEDLGWSSERVSEGFAELSRNGFAYRFNGVVFIPKYLAWNKVANGNVAKARLAEFWALPKGEAKARAARAILNWCGHLGDEDREALELFRETVPVTVTQTVCQTEPNPNQPGENPILLSEAAPSDPQTLTLTGEPTPPADLDARRQVRISTIADDAISAYNRILAKPVGLLAAVHATVGRDKRREQVRRCLKTASEICTDQFRDSRVTPEFWETYFGACNEDGFHSGKGPYLGAHANWRPDFEFLTRPTTMLKVFERATAEDTAA